MKTNFAYRLGKKARKLVLIGTGIRETMNRNPRPREEYMTRPEPSKPLQPLLKQTQKSHYRTGPWPAIDETISSGKEFTIKSINPMRK